MHLLHIMNSIHIYYLISSHFITFPSYDSYYDWQPYQRWNAGLFHGRSERMCWYLHLSLIEVILTVLSWIFYLSYDCSYFFLLISFFITMIFASSSFEVPRSTSFYLMFTFKYNLWYLNFPSLKFKSLILLIFHYLHFLSRWCCNGCDSWCCCWSSCCSMWCPLMHLSGRVSHSNIFIF